MKSTSKRQIVDRYTDGFRKGDPATVLECLADDVIWRSHGCQTFSGKGAFRDEICNEEFSNSPEIVILTYVEEGDMMVIIGHGVVRTHSESERRFSFCEAFKFRDDIIIEIDTFHIWAN